MEKTVSHEVNKMGALSLAGGAVVLVGAGLFLLGVFVFDWGVVPSGIIGLLIWGIGMAMLYRVEQIKKKNDVFTYQEILAFSKGEPIDRSSRKSLRARRYPVLKAIGYFVAAGCVGALIGLLVSHFGLFG